MDGWTMIKCAMLKGTSCGCSSVVERQLPKLNVVGSSPITRFKITIFDIKLAAHPVIRKACHARTTFVKSGAESEFV
jgi:hypothetical protein